MNKKKLYIISASLMILSLLGFIFSGILIEQNSNLLWTMIVSSVVFIILFVLTCFFYFPNAEFICKKCNKQFKPTIHASFWSIHTPTRRYLKCPHCNKMSFCKETWDLKN